MIVHSPFGSLTGMRDQGFVLHVSPAEIAPADYLGLGTPAEQAKAAADEASVAGLPPTRMIIESLITV